MPGQISFWASIGGLGGQPPGRAPQPENGPPSGFHDRTAEGPADHFLGACWSESRVLAPRHEAEEWDSPSAFD